MSSAHTHITSIEVSVVLDIPREVEEVFREFYLCEFSTLTKDGTPITWPVVPFFKAETGRFLIVTSIGLPQKVFNLRRNPKVSLLFSDSTASCLTDPPAVLVQGDAEAPDKIFTSFAELQDNILSPRIRERQRKGSLFSSNPLMRYLMDSARAYGDWLM